MKINVKIKIEDNNTCSRGCPFLEDSYCVLFREVLYDTILPDNRCWQDETDPTKQRAPMCLLLG